jgi:DHA1 family tetracycline resistance protein-like MFS transporter
METRSQRKPALGFIFITLILMVLGFSIIIPVLPKLVTDLKGGDVAEGSLYYGSLLVVFAVTQFIASPILGSLSDRYGRRRVILIALAGTAVDYVIMGWAPSMGWLFLARIISGATAGTLAACNAYIADVTPPEKRAQGFGLVGAAFGIGFVVGPALGGYFGEHNPRLPFYVAAGCVAANWLYGAFLLPESVSPENRRPFSWARANPVGSLMALRRFRGVFDLACMQFLFYVANTMLQSIWVLYAQHRYSWTSKQVGLSLTFVGIMTFVVQALMVKRIIALTGERKGLVLGLTISALVFIGYGLSTYGWMIYTLVLIGAWGGISGPSAQALITRHVPPNEQGALQGSLMGLQSLALIFAPLIATYSFSFCISHGRNLPGIAFFEASALLLGALVLAFRSFRLDDRVAARAAA